MLSLYQVERVVLPALKKAGLPTTTRRGTLAALTDGLADLPTGGATEQAARPDVHLRTFPESGVGASPGVPGLLHISSRT